MTKTEESPIIAGIDMRATTVWNYNMGRFNAVNFNDTLVMNEYFEILVILTQQLLHGNYVAWNINYVIIRIIQWFCLANCEAKTLLKLYILAFVCATAECFTVYTIFSGQKIIYNLLMMQGRHYMNRYQNIYLLYMQSIKHIWATIMYQ